MLPTITPHAIRHTAITNLVKSGADLPTIQRPQDARDGAAPHARARLNIDREIQAIGRALPEPSRNRIADATKPELHQEPKRSALPFSR
ncbi:MAG: hypothetical protein EXQ91_09540 [Alphaproteobacteria bacterium]|nr:hypothetical protein [Alphaproteobacteria bacterium]